MTTTIITTIRHNIGDDFVREGIIFLLDSIGVQDNVELVHKHSPVTGNYGWEKIRKDKYSKIVDPMLRVVGANNRISQADLLVQSGAPVYWCHEPHPHCADNEWFEPLIRQRFLPDRRGRKFVSLAGGSCQAYHSEGLETCPRCKAYIAEFFDACDLTMLRDVIAKKMLNSTGRDAEVQPCTSIFARDNLKLKPETGEYVVLNFMENGGHFTFGQDLRTQEWREQFVKLARQVAKIDKVVIACHTRGEEFLAKELVPEIECFLVPNEHAAFMQFYSRAKWGVMNRVHGAFMMASFGKPAVVVGNDTRARMMENLELPSYFVNDVKEVGVERLIDEARSRVDSYTAQIEAVRTSARAAYEGKLRTVLGL